MKKYSEDQHIKSLIEQEKLFLIDKDVTAGFETYIRTLPWMGSGLQWSKIADASSCNVSGSDARGLNNWLLGTKLGVASHICSFFSASQPSLACSTDDFFEIYDQIFWKAPGRRFLFAVEKVGDAWEPLFQAFAEFDGSDTFMSIKR